MRICSGAGCLRVVADDIRYCDECKPQSTVDDVRTHTTAYDEELDKLRKGTRWQRLRARVVREQPICARCDRAITEIVDHIVPAREAIAQVQVAGCSFDGYAGYFLRSNLQGLCRPCHYTKTIEDKAHTGPWPSVVECDATKAKRHFVL